MSYLMFEKKDNKQKQKYNRDINSQLTTNSNTMNKFQSNNIETFATNNSKSNHQSPKILSNKLRSMRPASSNLFSMNDLSKHSHTKGFINATLQYNPNEMIYYQKLNNINVDKEYKRPKTVINTRQSQNIAKNSDIEKQVNSKVSSNKANNFFDYKTSDTLNKYIKLNNNMTKRVNQRAVSARIESNHHYSQYFKLVDNEYQIEFKRLAKQNPENKDFVKLISTFGKNGSDIFPKEVTSDYNKQANYQDNYNDLNYFQEKSNNKHYKENNDSVILLNKKTAECKSSEQYLFAPKRNKIFDPSKRSESEWVEKKGYPSLFNHSSTPYNPINQLLKNTSNTKREVINGCNLENKINTMHNINNNASHKKKGMFEILDLNRNGAPNWNTKFTEQFNNDKNCFNKTQGVGGSYYDNYKSYKSICHKPFYNINKVFDSNDVLNIGKKFTK